MNFGHTVGHCLESFFLDHPEKGGLLHGEAVAAGIICECWISMQRGLMEESLFESIHRHITHLFSPIPIHSTEITEIAQYAYQDKKNEGGKILCTLVPEAGRFMINQEISIEEIQASLNYYRGLVE